MLEVKPLYQRKCMECGAEFSSDESASFCSKECEEAFDAFQLAERDRLEAESLAQSEAEEDSRWEDEQTEREEDEYRNGISLNGDEEES